MSIDLEIITPIKDYKDYYISMNGNVYSDKLRERKILKPKINRFGYNEVTLCNSEGRKSKKVHRLVAESFISNEENKPQVNHIDGNKTNNNVDNLEWVTAKENREHSIKNGLFKCVGSENYYSKLNENKVRQIKYEYNNCKISQRKLAVKYGVSQKVIFNVVNNKSWVHV